MRGKKLKTKGKARESERGKCLRKSKSKEGEKRQGETGGWRWGQSEAKGGKERGTRD